MNPNPWLVPRPYLRGPAYVRFGQIVRPTAAPPTPTQPERIKEPRETVADALRSITPTLIVVGIFTGAAFAIGSGLVQRYVFDRRR